MSFNRKTISEYILSRHQRDGGFHYANVEPSNGSDTFLAVKILSLMDVRASHPKSIYYFLKSLSEEGKYNNIVDAFFITMTLHELGYSRNAVSKMFKNTDPIDKLINLNTKKTEAFADSVSTLKNVYYATEIAHTISKPINNGAVHRYLVLHKNSDGGYGIKGESTLPDTYFSLHALSNINQLRTSIKTLNYLENYGNVVPKTFLEYAFWHFESLLLLGERPGYTDSLISYLEDCYREKGGFSRSPFQGIATFEDTYYALSIIKSLEKLLDKKILI